MIIVCACARIYLYVCSERSVVGQDRRDRAAHGGLHRLARTGEIDLVCCA
jgi:hypothetical protein